MQRVRESEEEDREESYSPLLFSFQSVFPCHSQYTRDQLDRSRRVIICRNRISDDPRIQIRINNSNRWNLVRRRFPQRVSIQSGREQDE